MKSNVDVSVIADGYRVDRKKIAKMSSLLLQSVGLRNHTISIGFVSPGEIRDLNKRFRKKDKTTDVLSFPQKTWTKAICVDLQNANSTKQKARKLVPDVLGDVVISLEDAEKNAKAIGQGIDRETAFLLVHGFLHLLGHDHIERQDETLMLEQQRRLMQLLSKPVDDDGSPLWSYCVKVVPTTTRKR